jgi:hypothetical protein
MALILEELSLVKVWIALVASNPELPPLWTRWNPKLSLLSATYKRVIEAASGWSSIMRGWRFT